MSDKLSPDSTAAKLLEQIIEKAELDDEHFKRECVLNHKAAKTVGESWMCHHLKILKGLISKGE